MNSTPFIRVLLRGRHHGGFVRIFCLSAGLLALLSISGAGHSHEVKPGDTPAPGESTAAAQPQPPLPGIVIFESAIGDVHFPHTRHQKMKCSKCHHQIHAQELDTPHDDYLEVSWIQCQICHEPDSEFDNTYFKCSGCHHAEPESIVDETISSKVVIHKSCWKCHKAGTGVKASERCSYCHTE